MEKQGGKDVLPPPLHIALGLWFEKSGGSRSDYVRLREILQLEKPLAGPEDDGTATSSQAGTEYESVIQSLPLKLDTLKRQVRRHIPLLQLMRKALPVIVEKMLSLAAQKKGQRQRQRIARTSWQYWYDPIDLIRTVLAATKLRAQMHFGMAEYADDGTELWHSRAWGSSIRATSGDVCFTQRDELIIPGDIVRLVEENAPITDYTFHCGRVIFIGRDHREDATRPGEVRITLQAILEMDHPRLHGYKNVIHDARPYELFLAEDVIIEFPVKAIQRRILVEMDRKYDGSEQSEQSFSDGTYFIRRVVGGGEVRPLRMMHQTLGELEVQHFGREYVEEAFGKPHVSFPYLLFIDGFGIHRNMYRSLKAFYLIPAALPYKERRKIANIFTLTLGPHGAEIKDVVEAIRRPIQKLDACMDMDFNGSTERVCAFNMAFLGDMPQQAENAGFLSHQAIRGCRTCMCSRDERGDLEYDIVLNGRYHSITTEQRENAADLTTGERKAYFRNLGIKPEKPPIGRLAPASDIILSRAYDAPHSEWRGLGRIIHSLLMTTILSKHGAKAYLKSFQNIRYPPGWPHIQSAAYYMWSWSLSETGRAGLLLPLIFRKHSTNTWFRQPYILAAGRVLNVETTAARAIVKAFGVIAYANTLVGSQRYTYHRRLHRIIVQGRQAYQDLITCAIEAARQTHRANSSDEDMNPSAEESLDENIAPMDERLSAVGDAESAEDASDELDEVEQPPAEHRSSKGDSRGKRARSQPKGAKFRKLLALPNVHAGLHLGQMAYWYSTVMNLSVLGGEMKHMWASEACRRRL